MLLSFKKWIAGIFLALSGTAAGVYGADVIIVDPYKDKGTYQELALISDIPQGERVEIAKDRAAMALKGWDNEFSLVIEPQVPTADPNATNTPFKVNGDRPLLSKKFEYTVGDVTAFIEPKENTTDQFDIDFILASKPVTNVFKYRIEGWEQFDFFYQSELTPEEIADGVVRPDNVIGSYAVYHKLKKDNRIGSTNYATGKVAHIYRPKAIDALGNEVWAELNFSTKEIPTTELDVENNLVTSTSTVGFLTVTVPQKFLNTATYPVTVDPTFGYEVVGGSGLAICFVASDTTRRQGTQFNLFETGTLDSITYSASSLTSSDTNDAFTAINRANNGTDSLDEVALVVQVNESYTTSQQWFTHTYSSEILIPDVYVLSAACDGVDASTSVLINYDATGGDYYDESFTGVSGFTNAQEDPWTEAETGGRNYSIYATYSTDESSIRTIDTTDFTYCRTMTGQSGYDVGGIATTTTGLFPLVATSTITDLKATSSSGDVEILDSNNELPLDVVFVDESTCSFGGSATAIPHYFEKFASTTGAFAVHLGTENISSTTDKVVAMYYGNSSQTTNLNSKGQVYATSSPLGPATVWDLSVPGSATTTYPDFTDATYIGNHGSSNGMNSSTLVDGYIGGALDFDVTDDEVGDELIPVDFLTASDYTLMAWFKPGSGNSNGGQAWKDSCGICHTRSAGGYFGIYFESSNFNVYQWDGNEDKVTGSYTTDVWTHIAGVHKDGTGGTLTGYKDGSPYGSTVSSNPQQFDNGSVSVGGNSIYSSGNFFDGVIDDVRMYTNSLSTADILTIYNNTGDSTTFWTFGSEETQSAPPAATGGVFQDILWFFF